MFSTPRRAFIALAGAAVVVLAGCSTSRPPDGIQAVAPFDLARYEGRWYEIARLDHRFERNMNDVSATYQRQPDGSVRVVNRGYDESKKEWREAVGKALFTGDPRTASLKVSFFGPFYGGYHVVALDPNYRWAIVVGPDRSYCWILSRDRQIAPALREQLTARVTALGIDPAALLWVSQQRRDPKP